MLEINQLHETRHAYTYIIADDIGETKRVQNASLYNSCGFIAGAGRNPAPLLEEGGASRLAAPFRRGTTIGPNLACINYARRAI